jgi:hypothetical protein
VPAGTLARAGYTVASPGQPPYCDLGRDSARRRWVPGGAGGCAIAQTQAEDDALQRDVQQSVKEAVLARVSGPGAAVGRDRLVWLVVVETSLLVYPEPHGCVAVPTGQACPKRVTGRCVVLVDGTTGEALTTVPVASPAAAAERPAVGMARLMIVAKRHDRPVLRR